MRISVFGLGYVGIITAACLAQNGHQIIGIDVVKAKVDMVNQGQFPIVEEGLGDLVSSGVRMSQLKATTSARRAIEESDMGIVCVGTPSLSKNGALNTCHVEAVAAEIGDLIRDRTTPFLFVLRSTVLPGTVNSLVIPTIEKHSGRQIGNGYDIVFHPEFLREGTSVRDFYNPPKIVVGERVPGAGQPVFDLYAGIEAPRFATSIEVSEMVKYADNAFHAIKITFANEIGQICRTHDVDSREVMDIFCSDEKLNISSKYLRPGFAFGGSCLPKDLRALLHVSRLQDISIPMLESVLTSNRHQIDRVLEMVLECGRRSVGLVGLSFKPGTDDLRESPLVELAERLIGKGVALSIWDEYVRTAWLIGTNKAYIEKHLPHLTQLLIDTIDAFEGCKTIIVGHPVPSEQFRGWLEKGIHVIDLVGSAGVISHPNYQGIAW